MLLRTFGLPAFVAAVCVAALLLISAASIKPPIAYAGCGSITLGGKFFIFNKQGITCKKAKGLARFTFRHNSAPAGWRCPDASPGNNRRDGANCFKARNPDKSYGYHVAD
jgi:hypothetical protein